MVKKLFPKIPRPTKSQLDSAKNDQKALREAGAISEERYKQQRKQQAAAWEKSFHYVAISGLWLLAFIAGSILVIFALHLVLPECRTWLSPERLDDVKSLLVGAGGAAAAKVFQKYKVEGETQND